MTYVSAYYQTFSAIEVAEEAARELKKTLNVKQESEKTEDSETMASNVSGCNEIFFGLKIHSLEGEVKFFLPRQKN